ncbi:MAG TPA: PP2C family protein-serine/threonine phosphatase [Thermoanaerobaculia bacterium]
MARFRDWLDLGKHTFSSLTSDDFTSLYSRDWTETRRALLAEHREAIDREPSRLRRWGRTVSAMAYGLTKRLSPVRRLVFVLTCVWFFFCVLTVFHRSAGLLDPWLFVEIGGAFVIMIVLLAMELIGKIKYRDELALARDLQATLIPKYAPRTPSYDISAFNHIANTVGGDLYDFVPLPDDRVAILFGDASGHGMAAGLVMAVAHAAFRTQLEIDPSPSSIIGSLNRILCRTGGSRSFFSCCYILLSPDGSFGATFAGHPQMLKLSPQGQVVERIGQGAYPLGIKSGLAWAEEHGSLARGERLLLYSDGLPESRDEQDRECGEAYVEAVVARHGEAPANLLVEALVAEWRKFVQHAPIEDDVSIMVMEKR